MDNSHENLDSFEVVFVLDLPNIEFSNGVLTRKKLEKALKQGEPMKVRSKKPSTNRLNVHIQDVLSLIRKLSVNNNVGEEAARMFGEYQKIHQKKTQAQINLD